MLNRGDALDKALEDLAALGNERDREQLAALRGRLGAARLRVLVAGEAKRGKSTLINALLSRPVLPSGVTPLTAVATTVRYGEDPHAEVRFGDGHEEKYPLAALGDLVTERGNPRNRRGPRVLEMRRGVGQRPLQSDSKRGLPQLPGRASAPIAGDVLTEDLPKITLRRPDRLQPGRGDRAAMQVA